MERDPQRLPALQCRACRQTFRRLSQSIPPVVLESAEKPAIIPQTAESTAGTANTAVLDRAAVDGLLAELADAVDSKSTSYPLNPSGKSKKSAPAGESLRTPCANDPITAELIDLLPRLTAKQRRQLLALAQSMIG